MRLALAAMMVVAVRQVPQNQAGTIEGAVMTAGAVPQPIPGARIKATGVTVDGSESPRGPSFTFETTTDGAGRFALREVPPGQYRVEAASDGYGFRSSSFAMIPVNSVPVTVSPGQRAQVPPFSMMRAATLRGQVIDQDGKGVAGAGVELLRLTRDEDGRKIWTRVGGPVVTDDGGKYQRGLLGPGDYYVRTLVRSGLLRVPFYHPETTEGDLAAPIGFAEGGEQIADIRIRSTPSSDTYKISGRVIRPASEADKSAFVNLILLKSSQGGPVEESVTPLSTAEMVLLKRSEDTPNGDETRRRFEFRGIPSGRYDLLVNASIGGNEYSSRTALDIRDADIERVDLELRPAVEVKGRVVVEGESTDIRLFGRSTGRSEPYRSRPFPGELKLALNRKDRLPVGIAGPGAPVVAEDGRAFSFLDVPEGEYDLIATIESNGEPPGPGYYVADIRAGGRSVFDTGFRVGFDAVDSLEVVIGTKGGSIEGRITGSTSPLPAALILVPEPFRRGNPALYRVLYLPRNGAFKMNGMAPGTYKLFAVPYLNETVPYRSAEFIARHESRAVTVTIQKEMTVDGIEAPYLNLGR
jgi:carboxypeptidase family protein